MQVKNAVTPWRLCEQTRERMRKGGGGGPHRGSGSVTRQRRPSGCVMRVTAWQQAAWQAGCQGRQPIQTAMHSHYL